MRIQSRLQLGSVANLLNGYRPVWSAGDADDTPLFTPPEPQVKAYDAEIDDASAGWSYPVITLHSAVEDLLNTLYAYTVVSLHDASPPVLPSGPLTVADADRTKALQALGNMLGVDVANPALSYMLVRLTREVGSASFAAHQDVFVGRANPSAFLERGLRAALGRLSPGEARVEEQMTGRLVADGKPLLDPTLGDVNGILSFFGTYGTHYVSKITGGDVIYQVFAFHADAFKQVRAGYENPARHHSGPGAVSFEYYTTPRHDQYGFAAAAGHVVAMSGDPAFAQSVQEGAWKDALYAGTDSVFRPFQEGAALDLNLLTRVVPIALELSPLANFADPDPRDTVRRVFKAAMYQKYGDQIVPAFDRPATYDYAGIFPQSEPGFVSTIATPRIDVYKERLLLNDVQLIAPETVERFSLFTQVLQLSGPEPRAVPGTTVRLLSHVIDVLNPEQGVPTLRLTDAAYATYALACQEFGGPLNVVDTSGAARHVIVDGFRYGVSVDAGTGRWTVLAEADVRVPPSAAVLDEVRLDVEMSLVAAEAVLGASDADTPTGAAGRTLILKYLNWIGLAIPSDTGDAAFLELRVRALYLARVVPKLRFQGSPVPYLRYEAYQPVVDATLGVLDTVARQVQDAQLQIGLRKQAELIVNVGTQLNENIVQTGGLLTGLIGTMADQQRELSDYYDQIAAQKKEQLKQSEDSLAGLAALLAQQRGVVDAAVGGYRTAVKRWEAMEGVKFALDLASGLFSVGASVAFPPREIAAAFRAATVAEKIKKLSDTFDGLSKIAQSLMKGIDQVRTAQAALGAIGDQGAEFPTQREWQELGVNMGAMLDTGPDVPAKYTLKEAFDVLVIRGQALLTARAEVQQIVGEAYLNAKRRALSDQQKVRLEAFRTYLHPASIAQLDTSKVDLVGLTGPLLSVQRQMLVILSRSLELQNQALRYEYLQEPVPIPGFDLLSLRQVMLAQKQAILRGLTSINPPPEPLPEPIVYTIRGIRAERMTGGNVFQFAVPLVAREFHRYAMVRVQRVVGSVSGVAGTDSGEYILNLAYSGDPFYDRGQHRGTLEFATPSRDIQYLYEQETNRAKFGTRVGAWQEQISRITPFSTWEASFPASEANQGIAFTGGTVDLSLSFDLVALLADPPPAVGNGSRPAAAGGTLDAPPALRPVPAGPPAALDTTTTQPTLSAVLSEMSTQGTVMTGWDVVFTMSEALVNQILLQQYTNRETDKTFFYTLPVQTYTAPPDSTTGNSYVTTFGLVLGTPQVQFLANNPGQVQLTMAIISGTYGSSVRMKDGTLIPVDPVAPISGGELQASLPLAKVQGSIQSQLDIVLNMAQGAFTTSNTTILNSNDPDFGQALNTRLRAEAPSFVINTLNMADCASIPGLTPTAFQINTINTESGIPILQLFITTNGQPQPAVNLTLTDPLPLGYDCSLLINTRILFEEVLVNSLVSGGSNISLEYVVPAIINKAAFSACATGGSFPIDLPLTGQVRISASSNSVSFPVKGMTIAGTAGGNLKASLSDVISQPFQYRQATEHYRAPPSYAWVNATLPVTLSASFAMPIAVTGTATTQTVAIAISPGDVTVTSVLDSAAGPCTSSDAEVQQQLTSQLQLTVPEQITKNLNMAFTPVSVFALENLLFPSNGYIDLSSAGAPGDLAIFGTITFGT